jgi:hypothetical protein
MSVQEEGILRRGCACGDEGVLKVLDRSGISDVVKTRSSLASGVV